MSFGERAFDDSDKNLDAFRSLLYEIDKEKGKDKEKDNDKEKDKDKDKHKDKGAYDDCNKDLDAFRSLLSEETSFSVNLLDDWKQFLNWTNFFSSNAPIISLKGTKFIWNRFLFEPIFFNSDLINYNQKSSSDWTNFLLDQ